MALPSRISADALGVNDAADDDLLAFIVFFFAVAPRTDENLWPRAAAHLDPPRAKLESLDIIVVAFVVAFVGLTVIRSQKITELVVYSRYPRRRRVRRRGVTGGSSLIARFSKLEEIIVKTHTHSVASAAERW